MILFVFMLLFIVVGVACVLVWAGLRKKPRSSTDVNPAVVGAAGALLTVIGALVILFSSFSIVGTSDVGIVTAFGHVEGGDLSPGLHLVPPWATVTTWDDSIQQTSFQGKKDCLEIRIAGQQSACLDVIVFWKDNPSGSDSQFRQYKTFSRVGDAFFSRGVVTKFYNNVFEKFDPVTLASTSTAGQQGGITVSTLTSDVLANMRMAYAGEFYVQSLNSGQITYDPQVEAALSKVVTAKANTNVAVQNEQAALAQHIANQRLQASLTPTVVTQNCLNITQTIIQAGGSLPPAWNCGGSGAGVLVTGK